MRKFAALAVAWSATAVLPAGNVKIPTADYSQFDKKLSKDQSVLHTVNRLTFGARPGDVDAVKKMGVEKWIDLQLHPERIPLGFELTLHPPPEEGSTPLPPVQYAQDKIFRAVYSNRQLEEVMADFWYNHFNVDMSKGADRRLAPAYERDAIRPHVFGKFRDLLEATANSPAMLFYLDNWQSVAPGQAALANGKRPARGLNENYARELMELHTLGVDGGYTQQDIIEVARCFTGWTIDRPNQPGAGTFRFDDRTHDKGEKVVLGITIPAGGGKEDGERVLDILAQHPSTAQFISKKLAQRFVADDPPPALLARMAATFQETSGDIRAVLATMFSSREFFSVGAYRSKVKTPLEFVVSAIRATGARVDSAAGLVNQTGALGEPLYRKIEPTGYSSSNAEWVSSSALLARMNFAVQLANNRVQGVQVDAERFSKEPAAAARQLFFADASSQTLQSIPKKPAPAKPVLIGLLLGSPDFQRR